MKCTQYFLFVRQRPDRAIIKDEWILKTMNNPLKTEIQSDGRIKKWSYNENSSTQASRYLFVMPAYVPLAGFLDSGFRRNDAASGGELNPK